MFGLEKLGWSRGAAGDGGGIDEHSIQFFGDDVTAVIRYDGDDLSYGNIGGQDLELEGAYFVKGLREPSCYEDKETKLSLEEINPVAFSETLHSLLQVTGFSYAASNENSLKEAKEILLKSLQTPEKKEEVFDEVDYTEIYNGFSAAWKKLLSDYCGITRSKNHKNIPKVTKLDLGRSDKIVSIQELKFFHKLEELEIDEPVKDASPLAELKSLKKIKLRNWNVKDLTILSSCPQLEEVELDSIQGFESDFDCSDLLSGSNAKISLDLVGTKFERFPAAVTTFQSLTSLSLRACNLSEVPDRIGNLKRLTNLNLSENQLTSLPAGFGSLEQLTTLDIDSNQFSLFPDPVLSLKNLKILSVLENQISSLPDGIGSLSSLKDLDFAGNQLSSLPSAISGLIQLTSLDLGTNKFSSFPEEVVSLKNLEELRLSENPFSSVPESIGNMDTLKILVLEGTQIDSLPQTMEKLTSLKYLYLSKTKLSDIPDFISKLKSLKTLHFKNAFVFQE